VKIAAHRWGLARRSAGLCPQTHGHRWGLALLCLALLSGCRRRRAIDEPPPPPPQLPVDTTLPGELAAGKDQAFGVPLPRVLRVTGSFAGMVMASGSAEPDQVANFFRSRVKAEKIETGPTKTVFTNVSVKSQPGVVIVIEVAGRAGLTSVTVRSVAIPRTDDSSTPEERMHKIGLNPDGSLADPTHLR
jgi:hypothetical protein